MLAQVPSVLVDIGTIAGVLIAVGTLIGLISRSRPGRYLWRQLVGQPVSTWFRGEARDVVEAVVDEKVQPQVDGLSADNGKVADALTDRNRVVDALVSTVGEHIQSDTAAFARIEETLAEHGSQFDALLAGQARNEHPPKEST